MKIKMKPRHLRTTAKQKVIFLPWTAVDASVKRFKVHLRKMDATSADSLVALVRGGLVLSVCLSHAIGVRTVKGFQAMKTASDNPHDYKKISIMQAVKVKAGEKVIIVEDIIFEGATVSAAIEHVWKKGAKVVAVCALIVDKKFMRKGRLPHDVPLLAAYWCDHLKWIRFPWEQSLRGEKIPKI